MIITILTVFITLVHGVDAIPREALLHWYISAAIILTLSRYFWSFPINQWVRQGRLIRRAVIVGGGTSAANLINELEKRETLDISICGIFDDRGAHRSPDVVQGYPKLGTISGLIKFARIARIDMLLVTIPIRAEKRIVELLEHLWVLPVDIRLSAHYDKLGLRGKASSFEGTVPFIDVLERPITDWNAISKRLFDVVLASLSLLVLWPIFLLIALAIKLETPGPVFFRQKRYGFNNELINILKFRSMYHHTSDPSASRLVVRGDKRVTKIGAFLRKTSLDELPQLLNVISGDLSLVGPRPHALAAQADNRLYEHVVDGYFARHKVKPGITGWAQINGWRGETDTKEKIQNRVECDIFYIENWSLFFDLVILFKTPFHLFNTNNAY